MLTPKLLLPLTLLLVFMAGIMLGFGLFGTTLGSANKSGTEQTTQNAVVNAQLSTTSKADTLRATAAAAAQSYTVALSATTQSVVRNVADTNLQNALDDRRKGLTNVTSSYLGATATAPLAEDWRLVTAAIVAYAQAVQQNNSQAIQTALTDLTNRSHTTANAYSTTIPTLSPTSLGLVWQRIVAQAKTLVDAQHGTSSVKIVAAEEELMQQLVTFTDLVTAGVVKNQPTLFQ